ncbi:MAG: 3-oxoacyl-[acyl-carrier protein] reductase [Acidobacteriota bacterium]|jgi:NAD(P)-dependent dehydrogenase (short-subunit alcohol dehydrogenase family)|nr:3-oxoacyl-[acyl-carrier protein] reductase [Acidobacteriota bacterium]
MPDEFHERVAIVTGASSGIGRATAELLAARGARVVVFSRNAAALAELVHGHEASMLAVAGDVADADAIERLFAGTESRFGVCELLVNNAGMIDPKPLLDVTPDEWDRMFAVNVRGTYLASRRALPAMIAKGRGAIVNVASISGVAGPEKFPGFVSYCASKAAVIQLTEALAVEVKPHGVRVNCISPGSVDTKMWADASGGAPASMTAHEIAESILFLASNGSRPMNGQNLNVFSA